MRSRYRLYQLAQWLNEQFPRTWSVWIGERLADVQYHVARKDQEAVRTNLCTVVEQPVRDESPMVREVFRNFARYLIEFLSLHQVQGNEITVEGYDELTRAVAPKRGCIILSAHVGNWELGAVVLRRLGFQMSVVALSHGDPRVNRLFDRQRGRGGVGVVPLGGRAAHACVQLLREGSLLGILGDRAFGSRNVRVSFFGRRVVVPSAPAILSLRTGAPVLPAFLVREAPNKYRFYFEPAVWPQANGTESEEREPLAGSKGRVERSLRRGVRDRTRELTQRYASIIERYIQRFPTQWLMFDPMTTWLKDS